MKSYTIPTAVVLAFALMIQPCPAPPVAIAIAAAAVILAPSVGEVVDAGVAAGETAILAGEGAAEGAAAAGDGAAGAAGAASGVAGTRRKRNTDGASAGSCLFDVVSAGGPQWQQMEDGSFMMHGVPSSCMAHVDAWNQRTDVDSYTSMWGSVSKTNASSITMAGMPHHVKSSMAGFMGSSGCSSSNTPQSRSGQGQGPSQSHQRRAMRFEQK